MEINPGGHLGKYLMGTETAGRQPAPDRSSVSGPAAGSEVISSRGRRKAPESIKIFSLMQAERVASPLFAVCTPDSTSRPVPFTCWSGSCTPHPPQIYPVPSRLARRSLCGGRHYDRGYYVHMITAQHSTCADIPSAVDMHPLALRVRAHQETKNIHVHGGCHREGTDNQQTSGMSCHATRYLPQRVRLAP